MAPTPQDWRTALERWGRPNTRPTHEGIGATGPSRLPAVDDKPEPGSFQIYCELEGIAASINTAKELGALSSTASDLQESLLQFYKSFLNSPAVGTNDPFCLRILWHSAYISLFADLNHLEIAAGRDGADKSQLHVDYAKGWSRSREGRRCALHATMILRNAENTPIGLEPAIHVPRALYSAAMVWYSYAATDSENTQYASIPDDDFPELKVLGIDGPALLFEAHGFKASRPSALESMTLVSLIDLHRRIGHADISDRMATLMTSIIHGHPEGELLTG